MVVAVVVMVVDEDYDDVSWCMLVYVDVGVTVVVPVHNQGLQRWKRREPHPVVNEVDAMTAVPVRDQATRTHSYSLWEKYMMHHTLWKNHVGAAETVERTLAN